jgi:hypothetical protein
LQPQLLRLRSSPRRLAHSRLAGGGTVTTAGNLVFQVINDGRLLAYSADKGEKLFELQTGRSGMAPPISYEVDGKQYVALMGRLGRPPAIAERCEGGQSPVTVRLRVGRKDSNGRACGPGGSRGSSSASASAD